MARFNRLDNQAPVQSQLEASKPNVGRSVFDFSRVTSGNTLFYMLTPVDCFDVVPGEDISLSAASYLEFRNPLYRPVLNGMRVYFHAYYNRLTDLWEGAQNFLDTGRSGKIALNRPNLIWHATSTINGQYIVNACTPMSLLNFLGLPVEAIQRHSSSSPATPTTGMTSPLYQFQAAISLISTTPSTPHFNFLTVSQAPDFFPADCAFAYQRNWRDFYAPKNLLQDNKYWFPDNEDHFILSYSCENAVVVDYENEDFSNNPGSVPTESMQAQALFCGALPNLASPAAFMNRTREGYVPTNGLANYFYPVLSAIKFRQFKGDRFTSALPFPDLIRGDIPTLDSNSVFTFSLSGLTVNVPLSVVHARANLSDGTQVNSQSVQLIAPNTPVGNYFSADFTTIRAAALDGTVPTSEGMTLYTAPISGTVSGTGTATASNIFKLSQNDIRALETFTVFKERMARTSGDYNDMIESQYGVSPHVHNRTGTYIGGFYQDFNLNVVTQTSESSADSPLGSQAASMSSNGSGSFGSFHVPDFGWIQVYMSIVHDVMYTQGIPRQYCKRVQTDMYFPIFNNLAPQAILNKELFISGNTSTDNDVFAYEDRYAEYKSRTNSVSGFMSLRHDYAAYDTSRVMSRRFNSTPSFNARFVTGIPDNVDMQVFTVYDEPPFDFSVGMSVRRVFPGPYTAIPGALSSNLHA